MRAGHRYHCSKCGTISQAPEHCRYCKIAMLDEHGNLPPPPIYEVDKYRPAWLLVPATVGLALPYYAVRGGHSLWTRRRRRKQLGKAPEVLAIGSAEPGFIRIRGQIHQFCRIIFQVVQAFIRTVGLVIVSRQIIVCTHNPNIVVSGDAEQVLVLDSESNDKGRLQLSGSIDNEDIINTVIDIMEGGKEAFRTRQLRYNM